MLIDSHCHIPHKKYDITPAEIVKDAQDAGVEKLISVCTSMNEAELVISTAKGFENVFSTVGIFPHEDIDESLEDLESQMFEAIQKHGEVVAVGECGIDISNWENGRELSEQIKLFEMQINLAKENSLPLIVHNRNGDEHILKILKKHAGIGLRGVVHCFDSNWGFAKKVLDLGFYVSFSGLITYPRRQDLLEVVKKVPEGRFLVETDAPYLPPESCRREINYPKNVRIVAEKVALVKEVSFEKVCEASYSNTCLLFGI